MSCKDEELHGSIPAGLEKIRFFADYELLEELGRGGGGIVFKARQLGINRLVALKLLAGGAAAGREYAHRFYTEAAAASKLDHPHIIAVYDFGEHEGSPFLAMQYAEGGTLQQRLAAGPLHPEEAARILIHVARAIDHAHQRGVLHRDLKPANVLLDAHGEPRVADFGLARLTEEESGVTLSGGVVGTAAYLAPEVALEGANRATVATDVYGLGAILYELLVGRAPFTSDSFPALLKKLTEEEPVAPRIIIPSIPRDLETLCLKCLEKRPEKRYRSAEELAGDLERFLAGEPVQARPVSWPERVCRWCQRKPALALTSMAGLLLLLFIVIGAPIALYRINIERRQAESAREAAKAQAYTAAMNNVLQLWDEGNLTRAQALLRAYNPTPGQRDWRGFEWRYLWRLCRDESLRSYTNFPSEVQMAASRDGRLVAAASRGIIRIIDLLQKQEQIDLTLPNSAEEITALCFSPVNPKLLATTAGRRLDLWDLGNREVTATFVISNGAEALAISPNGERLAVATGHKRTVECWSLAPVRRLWERRVTTPALAVVFALDNRWLISGGGEACNPLLWDPNSGQATPLIGQQRGWITALAVSPDGLRLAEGSTDSTVILWNLSLRQVVARLAPPSGGSVTAAAFSPDGASLIAGYEGGMLRLWDARTQAPPKRLFRGHQADLTGVAYAPDGRSFVSSSADRTVKVWVTAPESRDEILTTNQAWTVTSNFSPDGNRLATGASADGASAVFQIWDVRTHRGWPLPNTSSSGLSAFSPTGDVLAQVAGERIRFWNARTLALEGDLTNQFDAVSLAFSPDGKTLAMAGWIDPNLRGHTNRLAFWDLTRKQEFHHLAKASPWARTVAFSQNGKMIAVGYLNGTVRLWDFKTERLLAESSYQHRQIWALAFSPDDAWLAAGGEKGVVEFLDVRARRPLLPLAGTSTWIAGLCFAPDGKTLASAEGDGTVKFWSVTTRDMALTLRGHTGPLSVGLSFSPDGNMLATSGADGLVRLWRAMPTNEIPQP